MASEPLPGDYPLTLYRGDSREWTLLFTEDDGETPIDMSDNTWIAQVREDPDASAVLLTFDVDDTDAVDGLLVMTLDKAQWDDVDIPASTTPAPKWKWDLQGETGAGFVRTYLKGKVKILGDVSRAA